MKGFPNQVADLPKLAKAMQCIVRLVDRGEQAKDDGILGRELVRAGVAGTGHSPIPVEDYIRQQLKKTTDRQSFRTTARGLRELFRILGFIDDSNDVVRVTDLGRRAAGFAGLVMNKEQIDFWRRAVRNMSHDGGDGELSHPYEVLLRLIAQKPGITKTKCALALEAKNDSTGELTRIVGLVDLSEARIRNGLQISRSRRSVSEADWENAVKVLPKFAEQLEDVVRTGKRGNYRYTIADAPGRADAGPAEPRAIAAPRAAGPRAPRTSREVTPATIATTAAPDAFDEVETPLPAVDPLAAASAVRTRLDRRRRHNLIVQHLAARFIGKGRRLYEDPFDMLAVVAELGILAEVKTLDGTKDDERERVRDALSQLLYYEAFVTTPVAGAAKIRKVACFERQISDAHIRWLNDNIIAVIWQTEDGFAGDALASRFLGRFLEELA